MGSLPHGEEASYAFPLKIYAARLSTNRNKWGHCTSSGQKTKNGRLKVQAEIMRGRFFRQSRFIRK
jgi:hypothetical protein